MAQSCVLEPAASGFNFDNSTRKAKYTYKPGTTPVLTKTVNQLELELVHETVQMMETAGSS